ncbi:hypothetical protein EDD53_2602 [Pacificibacter maritimus]|uniref:DUF2125 domain-containing protein n=1 Tax=Pacificibacter maritimus TaxID=762213 RepID=A0A3N4U4Z2_9RHOB|nr:hypothetical protein [Pacificibacter maritimus]RPE64838.1 hypothetical protein EDD53_2602 [Pacificibacter maritimus]
MSLRTSFVVASCLMLPAHIGFADVSPQHVWENLQLFGQSIGQSYTAELEQNGDTLVARDVAIEFTGQSSELVTLNGYFPEIRFKALKRGAVEITFPAAGRYTSSIAGNPSLDISPLDIENTVTIGNTIIATGSPDDITFTVAPGTVSYVTHEQSKSGMTLVPEKVMTLSDFKGELTTVQKDGALLSDLDVSAQSINVTSNGSTDDVAMESTFHSAPIAITAAFSTAANVAKDRKRFLESMQGDVRYSLGETHFETKTGSAERQLHILGDVQNAFINTSIIDGSLEYGGRATQTEVTVGGSAVPFPSVDFGIQSATFGITAPYLASPDPRPVGIQVAFEQVRLPDVAWSMLDALGELPHEPATLRLDLVGNVISEIDLINPQSMLEAKSDNLPFQPLDLSLNDLFVSVGGATLAGEGTATFVDNLATSNKRLPFKSGEATLALTGGTALINAITASGLVAPQMGATAKMLLGVFARSGEGEDSYITDIELQKGKSVTVNGQKLPF